MDEIPLREVHKVEHCTTTVTMNVYVKVSKFFVNKRTSLPLEKKYFFLPVQNLSMICAI